MPQTLTDLTAQVLALPRRSRAVLVELLLETLDEETQTDAEAQWLGLAEKRDAEMAAGRVQPKTHEEVMSAAWGALACGK